MIEEDIGHTELLGIDLGLGLRFRPD